MTAAWLNPGALRKLQWFNTKQQMIEIQFVTQLDFSKTALMIEIERSFQLMFKIDFLTPLG